MAAKGQRNGITLACSECKQRNYITSKNKKNDPDRLEIKSIARPARLIPLTRKQSNLLHKFRGCELDGKGSGKEICC